MLCLFQRDAGRKDRVIAGDKRGAFAQGSEAGGHRATFAAAWHSALVSDQPWVQPSQQPITIPPGTVGSINFKVVRARRPPGVEGALTASLTLVYVAGTTAPALGALDVTPVNVSKVTVVDVTKPSVTDFRPVGFLFA